MSTKPVQTLILTLVALVVAGPLLAAGSSTVPSAPETPELDPMQQAIQNYNMGIQMRDKGWELEEKAAAESDPEKRAKLEKKAMKQFKKSISAFTAAVRNNPDFFQAHSALGYALRRTGEYQASLNSYNKALAIEPRYAEAIEYRGEAFLGLGRIEEAKEAYMELFRLDRARADELMTAMKGWLDQKSEEPDGVDAATLEDLASWIEERDEVSEFTPRLEDRVARRW